MKAPRAAAAKLEAAKAVTGLEEQLAEARAKVVASEQALAALDSKASLSSEDLVDEANRARELGRLEGEAKKLEKTLETAQSEAAAAGQALAEAQYADATQKREAAEAEILSRAKEVDAEMLGRIATIQALRREESRLHLQCGAKPMALAQTRQLFPVPGFRESGIEVVAAGLKRWLQLFGPQPAQPAAGEQFAGN